MSFGKSKNSSNSTGRSSSSTSLDPTIMGILTQNVADTNDLVSQMGGYTGQRVTGANEDQKASQGLLRAVGAGSSAVLPEATNTARGLSQFVATAPGYRPATAGASQVNRQSIRDIAAGQLRDTDLAPYLNPYTGEVIDKALADVERQRQIQNVGNNQRATASGAWGGSRHGVVDSLTNEAALRESGSLASQLRMAGFDRAAALAIGDIERRMGADQANQGVDLSVAGTNANLAQQAALANATSQNEAARFAADQALRGDIASAGVRQAGAGLLAALSDQQLQDALTRAGAVGKAGDDQRAIDQAALDADYEEFIRQQQAILAAIAARNQAAGLLGNPTMSQSSSTQSSTGKGSGFNVGTWLG